MTGIMRTSEFLNLNKYSNQVSIILGDHMERDNKYEALNTLLGGKVCSIRDRVNSDGQGETIDINIWKDGAPIEISIKTKGILSINEHPILDNIDSIKQNNGQFEIKQKPSIDHGIKDESSASYRTYKHDRIGQEIGDLFIKLWDAAGTSHYNKKEWGRLQSLLNAAGIRW